MRPLEGTRPQSTYMPPLSQSRGYPDTLNLTLLFSSGRGKNNTKNGIKKIVNRQELCSKMSKWGLFIRTDEGYFFRSSARKKAQNNKRQKKNEAKTDNKTITKQNKISKKSQT